MEVHHHSHTARKRWTHYFWEFLMLFLAVFCGFLAENKREKIVEQHRAKEYAKSLLADLQLDRDELKRGINQSRFMIESIDSLVSISGRMNMNSLAPGWFYYYGRFSTSTFRVDWSKSTIDQLIQSGNLRYFRNKELVGAINFYYYMQGIIHAQNQMDMLHRDKVLDFRNKIFLSRYYALFVPLDPREELKGSKHPEVDSLLDARLPLAQNAGQFMNEFINHALDRKFRLTPVFDKYYSIADETAVEIANMLIDEYHLKE